MVDIVQKINIKFKKELESQKFFFDKPNILKTLGVIGLTLLSKLIEKYSEDDIKKFLRTDKGAKDFIKYSSIEIDEQLLSDLLLKCQNGEITEKEFLNYLKDENLTAEGFLNIANKQNDFDTKINIVFEKINTFINNKSSINKTLTYSFLFYHIILQTIKLINNSEHPSKYRTKYIQRLSRNLSGLLKYQIKEVSEKERPKWEIMLKNLKQIDNLLLALGMATALYFVNRRLLQKKSQETLQTITKDKLCINILDANDVLINILPFKESLNCPIELDNIVTPHVPIEIKLANISCEFEQPEKSISDFSKVQDLTTKAIIKNNRIDKMFSILSIDSFVSPKIPLATINSTVIYSPIEGYISNQQTDQIILRDIKDPDEDLTTQINLLTEKYNALNDVKTFLKTYYIKTIYPILLATSISDDTSTKNITLGVNKEYNDTLIAYKLINDEHDKQIKNITGKDNIEKHANNETLNEIKDEIEKSNELYYKNLNLLGIRAENNSKQIRTKFIEYNLLTYYVELIEIFKNLINPTSIEIQFKDILNGFIKDRTINSTTKKQTIKEGNHIRNFTNNLWKQYTVIPTEIEEIEKLINSISMFSTYSITEYEGEQYRLYTIPEPILCKQGEEDDLLNPNTKYGYGDIQYWLKYCSTATLISVLNPATGWSTGWISPTAILFPVIYIPIKSVLTKYGFIVIGLSICGIYSFPWSLFVNYSLDYSLPFFDPTAILKNEINALKKRISEQLMKFKKITIKEFLTKTKSHLDTVNKELINYKELLKVHQNSKPPKYVKATKLNGALVKNLDYLKQLEKWSTRGLELRELIATISVKKWRLEQQYSLLDSVSKEGTSIKEIDAGLADQEKLINAQLDKLNIMTNNINKIVAPLPITMKLETVNFGMTLKRLIPLNKIYDEIDDNINEIPLNNFFIKFKLNNADLMSSNYSNKLSSSVINYNNYKDKLILAMFTIIKRDPFPKYERLSISNIKWMEFLVKNFTKVGATMFGWPGFPPYSVENV